MTWLGFEGEARLWIVFGYADASYVSKLLPDYLQLAPSDAFPPGMHPMMYSFGTQKVAMRPFTTFAVSYHESVIGVCKVALKPETDHAKRGGRLEPYSIMTATPVDSLIAMLIGRTFGFPKTMNRIAQGDASYTIATIVLKQSMVEVAPITPAGPMFDPANDPRFQEIASLLADPVISRAPWGSLLSSRFQIAKDSWRVTPVTARGLIEAQDIAGLPGGFYEWPPFNGPLPAAFLTEHRWTADLPSRI
jgi:hypothetical protein